MDERISKKERLTKEEVEKRFTDMVNWMEQVAKDGMKHSLLVLEITDEDMELLDEEFMDDIQRRTLGSTGSIVRLYNMIV